MAGNKQLGNAKAAKNDEFYTQLADIQTEVNAYLDYDPDVFRGKTVLLPCDDPEWSNFTRFFAQNFERFGLKKLISTSYAFDSKRLGISTQRRKGAEDAKALDSLRSPRLGGSALGYWQPTLFEIDSPQYDAAKSPAHGKIFILDHDTNGSGVIDFNDLEWKYLEGDGDFRSDEVCRLHDEADIIVTNPPFSLFREFLAWILEAGKRFAIIGNRNAITYKDVFPLIKANQIWLDNPFVRGAGYFTSPIEVDKNLCYYNSHDYREGFIRVPGVRWFTNIELARRHQPLRLMTTAENIKFSKHEGIQGIGYLKYDNYDAIEVPFTDAIPSDHDGLMGVPVSFLDKYCPEQFEIVGVANHGKDNEFDLFAPMLNGVQIFKRLLIRHKKGTTK